MNDEIRRGGFIVPEDPIDTRPEAARPKVGEKNNGRYPRGYSAN
jgi:hypothetical protein